eukprot:jgi/Hompol1/2859/HPOL_006198-RA
MSAVPPDCVFLAKTFPTIFKQNTTCCSLNYVVCDKSLSVTQLYLNDRSLKGPIPDLGALSALQSLDLRHNSLSGTLDPLSTLKSLTSL